MNINENTWDAIDGGRSPWKPMKCSENRWKSEHNKTNDRNVMKTNANKSHTFFAYRLEWAPDHHKPRIHFDLDRFSMWSLHWALPSTSENQQKSKQVHANPGKIKKRRKSWQNRWNSLKLLKWWKSTEFQWNQWNHYKNDENQWTSMNINEHTWNAIKITRSRSIDGSWNPWKPIKYNEN